MLAVILGFTLVPVVSQPAEAAISRDAFEHCLLDRANEERAALNRPQLQMAYDKIDAVRDWSEWMRFNEFKHMPSSVRNPILPPNWNTWGENIAMHSWQNMPNCDTIHEMWMNSSGHRANILNPSFRFLAVGTYVDGSGWWATQLFFNASDYYPACTGTFCDDEGSIFENDIEAIAAAGITQGCNPPVNNKYCPTEYVTRGVMAAFIVRALNLSGSGNVDFIDDNNSIFENDIEILANAGITKGCNPPANTMFCPDDYVTREVMAAFMSRALGLTDTGGIDFVDDNNSIFETEIERLAHEGITKGCNPPANTMFCPKDYVTRGVMAAFLARALDL